MAGKLDRSGKVEEIEVRGTQQTENGKINGSGSHPGCSRGNFVK